MQRRFWTGGARSWLRGMLIGLLAISAIYLTSCKWTRVVLVSSERQLICVPQGTRFALPNKEVVITPCDGVWMSDAVYLEIIQALEQMKEEARVRREQKLATRK